MWSDIPFHITMNSPFYWVNFDIDVVNHVELWGPILQNEKKGLHDYIGLEIFVAEDQLRVSLNHCSKIGQSTNHCSSIGGHSLVLERTKTNTTY